MELVGQRWSIAKQPGVGSGLRQYDVHIDKKVFEMADLSPCANALLDAQLGSPQTHRAATAERSSGQECLEVKRARAKRVVAILEEWGADSTLLTGALLGPFVGSGGIAENAIAQACGSEVAQLCRLYHDHLASMPLSDRPDSITPRLLARLFLAGYCEPKLAIIGAASLWQQCVPAIEQGAASDHVLAIEARSVLIPLLGMLGMWQPRTTLETLLARSSNRQEDTEIQENAPDVARRSHQQLYFEVKAALMRALPTALLRMREKSSSGEGSRASSVDVLSVDVVMENEAACYLALYQIHRLWRPEEGAVHDYVGASKINGYRCLQTSVQAIHNDNTARIRFHIRTSEMDEINNWGVAAIYMRKKLQTHLPHAWWTQRQATYQRLCRAPIGALPETLYVFSPQGQVFEFERGCTVVDYAYQVSSELAAQCVRFLINDQVVRPTMILHHMDVVELEHEVGAPGPTRLWLSAARTGRARTHIDRFLKRRGGFSDAGRRVLGRRLAALESYYGFSLPKHRVEQGLILATRRLNLPNSETLLEKIANGVVAPDKLLHPLFSEEMISQLEFPDDFKVGPSQIRLAQCCRPRPGEDILGRLRMRGTRVQRVTVHKAACKIAVASQDLMVPRWRLHPALNEFAELDIVAIDEPGLLGDTLQIVYDKQSNVTLHQVSATAQRGTAHISLTIEASDDEQIAEIMQELEGQASHTIETVRRMKPSLSVLGQLNRARTSSASNPYSRLPVSEREMLFGRNDELAHIRKLLDSNTTVIYLRGRKRVGKTSMLLHLRDYYLDRKQFVPCYVDFQMFGTVADGQILYEIANTAYHYLQRDGRLGEIGPPLREIFSESPANQFSSYLQQIQSHFAPRRLVLLIDEFSVVMDAYRTGRLADIFFFQWRGILQAISANITTLMVVQQRAIELAQAPQSPVQDQHPDPCWQVLELGASLSLKPLRDKDTRSLIERPTRNYLTYSAQALDRVVAFTGPSPFIVQAFCHALVQHMADQQHRTVAVQDVEAVAGQFMDINENLFDYAALGAGSHTSAICAAIGSLSGADNSPVALEALESKLTRLDRTAINRGIQSLCEQGILRDTESHHWQFTSLLFQKWIRTNIPDAHAPYSRTE